MTRVTDLSRPITDPDPVKWDPAAQRKINQCYRETLYVRELLTECCEFLEAMADEGKGSKKIILAKAAHFRSKMHHGPPKGWRTRR